MVRGGRIETQVLFFRDCCLISHIVQVYISFMCVGTHVCVSFVFFVMSLFSGVNVCIGVLHRVSDCVGGLIHKKTTTNKRNN